jgi:hypothetical protein
MRILDIKDACDRLADIIWWHKGFNAACREEERNDVGERAREVRSFLDRVSEGDVRRLGEETVIVLKFHEWEAITDFLLMRPAGASERAVAISTVQKIHQQYQDEDRLWRESKNPDIPF